MSDSTWERLRAVFCDALDLPSGGRAAFLDRECASEPILRQELEAMLDAHEHPRVLSLERRMLIGDADAAGHHLVGEHLGPWKLTAPLGRGGSSEVYVAERADGQFQQRVAVKVVQPGWSPAGLAERLRLEREILAALRHPSIATLFDGGVTSDGRPYLVMELVDGLPITVHCDERQLSIEERLGLFVDVCRAVQFAHGALVVHRDLKPSNILVTAAGDVKLLDFGIAKLLDAGRFNLEIEVTRLDMRLLTPHRAAPEQFAGGPITTATDVWALGILLHELLTGHVPHHGSDDLSPSELERRIASTPAPRPSATIVRLDESISHQVAGRRRTRPGRLARRLRGDLDRIVGKALRIDPERRYASAGQLADDVERVLASEPIAARPESWRYHAERFVRRHRWAVASGALAAGLLITATVVTTVQSRVAAHERDRAAAERDRAEAVTELLVRMLEQADPVEGPGGDTLSVADLLELGESEADRLSDRPDLQVTLFATLGRIHVARSRYDDGRRLLEAALTRRESLDGPDDGQLATILSDLGVLAAFQGRQADARRLLRRALETTESIYGSSHPQTARVLQLVAVHGESDPARREQLVQRVLEIWETSDGDQREAHASALSALARLRVERGDRAQARDLYRQAFALMAAARGDDDPRALAILNNLATLLDEPSEVLAIRRTILAAHGRRYGDPSTPVAIAWNNLGTTLARDGRHADARAAFEEAVARWVELLGSDHSQVGNTVRNIARTLVLEGRDAEALPAFDRALAILSRDTSDISRSTVAFLRTQRAVALARSVPGDDSRREVRQALDDLRDLADGGTTRYLGEALVNRGLVELALDDAGAASAAFREAVPLLVSQYGESHPKTAEATCGLAVASGKNASVVETTCSTLGNWGVADPELRHYAPR